MSTIQLLQMHILGASAGNIVSSVALVLANKRAVTMDGFDFMIVLTGLHFYTSFMCCLALLIFGYMQYKQVIFQHPETPQHLQQHFNSPWSK